MTTKFGIIIHVCTRPKTVTKRYEQRLTIIYSDMKADIGPRVCIVDLIFRFLPSE